MPQYTIRIVDEKGKPLPEEILAFLDLDFSFDKPFEALHTAFPTVLTQEYIVKTESEYCSIMLNLGRIILFSYSGKPKDLAITIPKRKIDAIKTLLG